MASAYHARKAFATGQGTSPHFVLFSPSKKPMSKGWQKAPATTEVAEGHASTGGLVGLIPSSLGLVTVDVDKGGALAVTAVTDLLGTPLAVIPSQTEGHFHLWYKSESKRKALYQWEIEGKGSGEVLYS